MADQSRAGYDKILFECFLEFRKYSEYFITKSKVGKTSAKKLRLLYLLVSHNDSDNFNVARQRCVPTECCLVSICDMSIQIYSKSGNNDFQLKEYSNCCTYSTNISKFGALCIPVQWLYSFHQLLHLLLQQPTLYWSIHHYMNHRKKQHCFIIGTMTFVN